MAGVALSGRRGVVIGGASGIGRAVTAGAVERGARVAVGDLDAAAARASLRATGAYDDDEADALAGACDVRDPESVERFETSVRPVLGGVDFVVMAAGVTQSGGIVAGSVSDWRRVIETNVLGVAHVARAFFPALGETGAGQLVILASLSGREANAGQPVYVASKWGSVGLGHSLRKEGQDAGVRVTLIEPGIVDTPMSRGNPHAAPLFEQIAPLQPEDVANAMLYVLEQPQNVLIRELALQPVQQRI